MRRLSSSYSPRIGQRSSWHIQLNVLNDSIMCRTMIRRKTLLDGQVAMCKRSPTFLRQSTSMPPDPRKPHNS